MKFHRSVFQSILALAAVALLAGTSVGHAQQQDKNRALKKYESGTKEFWTHPPDDWFLGDETEAQKGLAPPSGPPTGASEAELAAMMKKIKLPPGFKIEVYAPGVLAARQMAWGDKGTLFVGSFGLGNVYAIKDNNGKKEVKTVLKGLNMPTGLAFKDGALYVIAVDTSELSRRCCISAGVELSIDLQCQFSELSLSRLRPRFHALQYVRQFLCGHREWIAQN